MTNGSQKAGSQVPVTQIKNSRSDAPPEIITITSGKGGVGKSNICANLGILLAQRRQRVLLLDADLHLGKLDIILGATPRYTLGDLAEGKKTIQEVIMHHPAGIDVLPATSGDVDLIDADNQMLKVLGDAFGTIQNQYDYILVDTGAGISQTILTMALGADKVILVVTSEPASIADVYAMVKVISMQTRDVPLILVPNRQNSVEDGLDLHKKLNLVIQKFLKANIIYGGSIVEDTSVRQAVMRQRPVVLEYPRSPAANNLQLICHRLLKMQSREIKYRSNLFDRIRDTRKIVESL